MSGKEAARRSSEPGYSCVVRYSQSGSVGGRQARLDLRTPRAVGNRLGLTPLELHLISDLLAGFDDAEIAQRASLNQGKLDACLAAVFERLGVRDRLELALLLVHNGL